MLLTWTAAGLLHAEKRFHRIRGYRLPVPWQTGHLHRLASALQKNMKSNHKEAA